jgi:hypothetical protein
MLGACGACAKPCARRLVCARCKAVGYCSKECQTLAWQAGHRRECVSAAPAPEASRPPAAPEMIPSERCLVFARAARLHEARDWPRVAVDELQFAAAARPARLRANRGDVPAPRPRPLAL